MLRNFFVINLLIILAIFILSTVFSINDNVYGWSHRLASNAMFQSVIMALVLNKKLQTYPSKKTILGIFIFIAPLYYFILILFCKEHLAVYMSKIYYE
jgi:hypothetical protein